MTIAIESVTEIGTVAEIGCGTDLGVLPGSMSSVAIIASLARCQHARCDGHVLITTYQFMDDFSLQVHPFIRDLSERKPLIHRLALSEMVVSMAAIVSFRAEVWHADALSRRSVG